MDAIIYAAKSTADAKGSIPTQLADCRAHAERESWSVVAEYQDEAKSAYHGSRGDGLAKAQAHAEALAPCALIVQHSDRLARGDGVQAQHLVEVTLWANKAGVTIVSLQDPRACESILDAALMGMRNNEDSERKSQATKSGLRRTVERGEWRGGIVPGGYEVERVVGDGGRVTRKLVKHPDDEPIYDLIWRLAEQGKSVQAISLELNRRGYMTRPVRKTGIRRSGREVNYQPRPFTANRVSQALGCPVYAGLQTFKGETFPGEWPTYVDVDVFHRLKSERAERANTTKRRRGRPPRDYLLTELGFCGQCGERMQGCSDKRRDRRSYACAAHREHHRDSELWCSVTAFDAVKVDTMILANLDQLLTDADSLREQLSAGQTAERLKLEKIASDASAEASAAERAAERATAEFADADDDDERALLKDAAKRKRAEAAKARSRADAALDALNQPQPEADDGDVMARIWRVLSGAIADAEGDVKAVNAALRETFERFDLHHTDHGFLVVPTLSPAATVRALKESGIPEDATVPSLRDGRLSLPAFVA